MLRITMEAIVEPPVHERRFEHARGEGEMAYLEAVADHFRVRAGFDAFARLLLVLGEVLGAQI